MSLAKVDNFSAICGLFRWCLLQLRERVRCARFYPYPAFLLLPHAELVSVCLELNKNLQEIPRARVVDDSTDEGRRVGWHESVAGGRNGRWRAALWDSAVRRQKTRLRFYIFSGDDLIY